MQLGGAQYARQHSSPQRNEQEDKDGEADGRYCLGDGKGGAKAEKLNGHKNPNGGAALDTREGVRGWSQGVIAREKNELGRDAVRLERLDAHDEEEPGEDAVRNEMQADE